MFVFIIVFIVAFFQTLRLLSNLPLKLQNAVQIVDRFGGMEGKQQSLRRVVGFKRTANALKRLARRFVRHRALQRAAPPVETVVIEQRVPVLARSHRRVVERAAAKGIVHDVDQIGLVFGSGVGGALEERVEAQRAALGRVGEEGDGRRLLSHFLRIATDPKSHLQPVLNRGPEEKLGVRAKGIHSFLPLQSTIHILRSFPFYHHRSD